MARCKVPVALVLLLASVGFGQSSFVNWEDPHVHPLDITPDGQTLLAVNTADNRLEVFDISSGRPVAIGAVPVGLDPVSVRARSNTEVWVVNHISDTVSVVDLVSMNVVTTIQTDDEPADVVFAGVPVRAFVSCSAPNTILVIDPSNPNAPIVERTSVPGPIAVGVSVRVHVVGEDPRALAVSTDGLTVYIAMFESGNESTILGGGDLSGGSLFLPNVVNSPLSPYFDSSAPPALGVNPPNPPPNDGTGFLPPIGPTLPPPPRVGLIVKRNAAGQWMDDNGHDWTDVVNGANAAASGRPIGWTLQDHDVGVMDSATLGVRYFGGMANICMALAVNPTTGRVSVVGTDATNDVRFEPVLNGRFLRVNWASFDPVGALAPSVMDLNPHLTYPKTVPFVPLPVAERARAIGDPRGITYAANGTRGYVTGMGSNNVIIINADGTCAMDRPIPVGQGPTGIVLDEGSGRLFVLNKFDGTISTINTVTEAELLPRIAFYDPTPAAITTGRKHLYDTHRTSGLGHVSCGSCHVDARLDRLAWELGDPSGSVKPFNQNCNGIPGAVCDDWHPMKGPMTTQTLQDIIGHEPFHWRGGRDGIEAFNGAFVGLLGDDEMLTPAEMQEFEDFLATIHFPPNPFRDRDNMLPTNVPLPGHFSSGRFFSTGGLPAGAPLPPGDAVSGLAIYRRPNMDAALACVTCHTLPTGMGFDGVFIGTTFVPLPPGPLGEHHIAVVSSDGSTNRTMKIPQLRNMYDKVGFEMTQLNSLSGFGLLHDGSVDSIARFVSLPAFSITSDQDVSDLVAFMLALSGSDLPQGSTILEPPGPPSLDTHAAVGWQITFATAPVAGDAGSIVVNKMAQLADAAEVGLIAKGIRGGLPRGYTYIGAGLFQSDRLAETLSLNMLLTTNPSDGAITFTVTPFGSQRRIGIDRDEDGLLDRDELDLCTDPADPNNTVPVCDTCLASADCAPNAFCKFVEGSCLQAGRSGICTPLPQGCPDNVDPVCGCDGVTYSNACEADAVGISVAYLSECPNICCDPALEPGTGSVPPCIEGASCCSDGTWRCNDGFGQTTCPLSGITCGGVCGGIAGIPCGDNEFCKLGVGECCCDFMGVCTPDPGACPEIFDPVCGCDGITYANACFADAARVSIAYLGECNPDCTLALPAAILPGPPQNRYLGIIASDILEPTAIRVRTPAPPGSPEGEFLVRWVGPIRSYPEEGMVPTTFFAGGLQCEPHFVLREPAVPIQVFGAEVIPQSDYIIDVLRLGCAPQAANPSVYSPAVTIRTAKWGDVVQPFFSTANADQPDFRDINALVQKFLGTPGAPSKARTQLQPNVVFPARTVDFRDISADVEAFLGTAYADMAWATGSCACPSAVRCNATSCAVDVDCGDGFCINGFCTDSCARCAP